MPSPSSNKRALLIGINDYPYLPGSQLNGCINDVNLMRRLLSGQFKFADENIKTLCNREATKLGILNAFRSLVGSVGADDVVVVYFAGHGSRVQGSNNGSGFMETIVPYDSGRKSTGPGYPVLDITDDMINQELVMPLVCKTSFVTLFFECCHSGSIFRDDFGMAKVRGIDPDVEVAGINRDIIEPSDWSLTPTLRIGHSPLSQCVLLAACRADERAFEIPVEGASYGIFTSTFCSLIHENRNEAMRTLFHIASARVTARFPNQHPIMEGPHDAFVFGTPRLNTPRSLAIKNIEIGSDGKTLVNMDGGLASGVTRGSIWAIRHLGDQAQDTDPLIKVREVSAFVSHAEVTRGHIQVTFGSRCFEIRRVYGSATLNVFIDPSGREEALSLARSGNSDSCDLDFVENANDCDVRVVRLNPKNSAAMGGMLHGLGPMNRGTWVALARDGHILFPPVTHAGILQNLRKLARYQFGIGLCNVDEDNELRDKLRLELKWRPKGSDRKDPWQAPRIGKDGLPHFGNNDHIACVIKNFSNIAVWPYVLEFAEDGSVNQRYPEEAGEQPLASGRSTGIVAKMGLAVADEKAFQSVEHSLLMTPDGWKVQKCGGVSGQKHFTEVLKLFASSKRVNLSALLQESYQVRGDPGLSSLLRTGENRGRGDIWWTVDQPFVLESDPEKE